MVPVSFGGKRAHTAVTVCNRAHKRRDAGKGVGSVSRRPKIDIARWLERGWWVRGHEEVILEGKMDREWNLKKKLHIKTDKESEKQEKNAKLDKTSKFLIGIRVRTISLIVVLILGLIPYKIGTVMPNCHFSDSLPDYCILMSFFQIYLSLPCFN